MDPNVEMELLRQENDVLKKENDLLKKKLEIFTTAVEGAIVSFKGNWKGQLAYLIYRGWTVHYNRGQHYIMQDPLHHNNQARSDQAFRTQSCRDVYAPESLYSLYEKVTSMEVPVHGVPAKVQSVQQTAPPVDPIIEEPKPVEPVDDLGPIPEEVVVDEDDDNIFTRPPKKGTRPQ